MSGRKTEAGRRGYTEVVGVEGYGTRPGGREDGGKDNGDTYGS